tara:strand:+ start:9495 stop:9881 length:387 start_codon:yes stop_codon:yes gene_type:complete
MILVRLQGDLTEVNDSLKLGDMAYYVKTSLLNGFTASFQLGQNTTPQIIGTIVGIEYDDATDETTIECEDSFVNGTAPGEDDFLMFAKASEINLSGLVGYYSQVELRNNSREKAEIYSVGAEVTASSK